MNERSRGRLGGVGGSRSRACRCEGWRGKTLMVLLIVTVSGENDGGGAGLLFHMAVCSMHICLIASPVMIVCKQITFRP